MSAVNFVKVCAGEDTRAIDDIHVFILFKTIHTEIGISKLSEA